MMLLKSALLLGLAGLLPAICSGQATTQPEGATQSGALSTAVSLKPTGAKFGLTVRISTDKKVHAVGEPIKMTVSLRNTTRSDIRLTFSSGQRFDFKIYAGAKPTATALWTWSRDRMFTMMVAMETLKPGTIQQYTAVYDAKAGHSAAPPLSPGTYTVVGNVTAAPANAIPVGVTFRVK